MGKIFELQGVEFEWDEEKYAVNLRKHGVKFEEAAEAFFDRSKPCSNYISVKV